MSYWEILRSALGSRQIILPSVAGAILKDGRILLARHGDFQKWHIPGGIMELDESVEDTMRREIKEELNLDMEIDRLIAVLSDPKWLLTLPNGDVVQQLTFFFLLKGDFDERDILLQQEEITEYRFFALDDLPSDTMDCCVEKIRCLQEFRGEVFLL